MKVALIGNQAFGLLNFRGALIARLVALGHDVFALVPDYNDETRAKVLALGATPLDHKISRAGMNPIKDLGALLHLRSTLNDIKPELVLAYTVKPVVYGLLAARSAGVRRRYALIEGLGHAFIHRETIKQRLLQLVVSSLYRLALSQADFTLFLNDDDKGEFERRHLVSPNRATVIGTIGLDLDDWPFSPPVLDPVSFLFVGRMLREKGVFEYIDAARTLRARYPSARFILVGDVDCNPSSIGREALLEWTQQGLIEWAGHTDVRPWIAASSVFVLPSYREGFPRSTQEAMAMGRPVITTDVPGCRETVVAGYNGFLVPPRNADALAGTMQRFLDDPQQIEILGRASRIIAQERFGIRQATDRLLDAMDIDMS